MFATPKKALSKCDYLSPLQGTQELLRGVFGSPMSSTSPFYASTSTSTQPPLLLCLKRYLSWPTVLVVNGTSEATGHCSNTTTTPAVTTSALNVNLTSEVKSQAEKSVELARCKRLGLRLGPDSDSHIFHDRRWVGVRVVFVDKNFASFLKYLTSYFF